MLRSSKCRLFSGTQQLVTLLGVYFVLRLLQCNLLWSLAYEVQASAGLGFESSYGQDCFVKDRHIHCVIPNPAQIQMAIKRITQLQRKQIFDRG